MGLIYRRNGVQIWLDDCLEAMTREWFMADLVLTDPPYGVQYAEWDHEVPSLEWLDLARKAAPSVILTPGNSNLWEYPKPTWLACWARPGSIQRAKGGGFSHWEPILIYGRSRLKVDCRIFPPHTGVRGVDHPCPKPPALWRWLMEEQTQEGDLVLDPFLGSGTTCLVGVQLGRRIIGVEREERYCQVAIERTEAALAGVDYRRGAPLTGLFPSEGEAEGCR